jgi:hypothetical protein
MSKKAKCMAEGDLVETQTAQGQNKMIDDDTRAKALDYVNSRVEDEPMLDSYFAAKKKSKPKAKSKSNAATQSHSRMNAMGDTYKKGGSVGSASKRADGIAQKGKTKGKWC